MRKYSIKEKLKAIDYLTAQFPKTFFKKGFEKPLAIGIHKKIFFYLSNISEDKPFSNLALRAAIHFYAKRTSYLESLRAGSCRVNIDGIEAGQVTQNEEAAAKEVIAARKAAQQRRVEQDSTKPKEIAV